MSNQERREWPAFNRKISNVRQGKDRRRINVGVKMGAGFASLILILRVTGGQENAQEIALAERSAED